MDRWPAPVLSNAANKKLRKGAQEGRAGTATTAPKGEPSSQATRARPEEICMRLIETTWSRQKYIRLHEYNARASAVWSVTDRL